VLVHPVHLDPGNTPITTTTMKVVPDRYPLSKEVNGSYFDLAGVVGVAILLYSIVVVVDTR